MAYRCPRCTADPQPPHFGDPRRCAFQEDGSFTPDNWNCATLEALLSIMQSSFEHDGDDESMQGILCDPEETRGWILLARYKHRGCTSSAIHFGDEVAQPITLALVESTIAWHMRRLVEAGPRQLSTH